MKEWFSGLLGPFRRRRSSNDVTGHRAITGLQKAETKLDDDKTIMVGPTGKEPFAGPEKTPVDVIVGSKASSRLSWPARDEHRSPTHPVELEGLARPPADSTVSKKISIGPNGNNLAKLTNLDAGEDDRTQLVGPSPKTHPPLSSDKESSKTSPPTSSPMMATTEQDERTLLIQQDNVRDDDPVVGWLVVMNGPGKGRSIEIKMGVNSIGRAPNQMICLDFGDTRISYEQHAVLIYDPRSRQFFLQNNNSRHLTYVGDQKILAPVELSGGETITVGKTQVRFVALCGSEFSWT